MTEDTPRRDGPDCAPDGVEGPGVGPGARPGEEPADAAVYRLLSLLGKRHTLALLYLFARDRGPWRFGELAAELDVSPTTLTDRLRELTAAGFLDRTAYDETPPRVEYVATDRAEALKPAFGALYRWVGEHDLPEAR